MITILFSLATLPLCFSDQSKYAVIQGPKDIITAPDKEQVLDCSHLNPDFEMILWYRRSIGHTALTLVAFARYSNLFVEDTFEKWYKVSGSGTSRLSLHVVNVTTASNMSAVYFCAAKSHSEEKNS
ncbi:unnamed protein product [Knipowitschia caucasica]